MTRVTSIDLAIDDLADSSHVMFDVTIPADGEVVGVHSIAIESKLTALSGSKIGRAKTYARVTYEHGDDPEELMIRILAIVAARPDGGGAFSYPLAANGKRMRRIGCLGHPITGAAVVIYAVEDQA